MSNITHFVYTKHAGIAFINSVPEGTYDVIILDAFQPMGKKAFFVSKNVNFKLELNWEKTNDVFALKGNKK